MNDLDHLCDATNKLLFMHALTLDSLEEFADKLLNTEQEYNSYQTLKLLINKHVEYLTKLMHERNEQSLTLDAMKEASELHFEISTSVTKLILNSRRR